MTAKEFIWLAGIALLLHPASFAQSVSGHSRKLICWCETRKLTWQDFQATSSQLQGADSLGASVAPWLTVDGLIDANGRHTFSVRALLDRKRAWVRDSTVLLADEMLQHEQLHFDICELMARRLRLRISQLSKTGGDVFAPSFEVEIKRLLAEYKTLQKDYDRETDHGSKVAQQQSWRDRIKRE
jgi:CRP-like cAMP-binding protein